MLRMRNLVCEYKASPCNLSHQRLNSPFRLTWLLTHSMAGLLLGFFINLLPFSLFLFSWKRRRDGFFDYEVLSREWIKGLSLIGLLAFPILSFPSSFLRCCLLELWAFPILSFPSSFLRCCLLEFCMTGDLSHSADVGRRPSATTRSQGSVSTYLDCGVFLYALIHVL